MFNEGSYPRLSDRALSVQCAVCIVYDTLDTHTLLTARSVTEVRNSAILCDRQLSNNMPQLILAASSRWYPAYFTGPTQKKKKNIED